LLKTLSRSLDQWFYEATWNQKALCALSITWEGKNPVIEPKCGHELADHVIRDASEVTDLGSDNRQVDKQDENETYLGESCEIVQAAAETITIAGREYVFAIMPGQR
jgi:hypothetical protein